jgi:2-desacetyl-2-hydroxyethyl bacteriochlorophyllide A dehydrogenase
MRAIQISAPGQLGPVTLPDPEPGPFDVVLAVDACGICGTDLHILDGELAPFPVVPGHELAGEVVATGAEVRGLRVGDHVAVDPAIACGRCHHCRHGRPNQCEEPETIGISVPGGAAELVRAPAANCVAIPEHVDPATAALIEPLACAVRGFDVLQGALGDHVLIYGAGTIGLINLQLALRTGAAGVCVVDTNPARLEGARQLGCTAAATSADELDRPRGFEIVIDCTGVAAAIEDGIRRVATRGTFMQFGVSSPGAVVRIEPYRIFRDELTIVGSNSALHSFERAAELFFDGVIDPDVLVGERIPLHEYPAAVERVRRGAGRKVLVTPRDSTD